MQERGFEPFKRGFKCAQKKARGKSAGTEWEIDGERGNGDGNNEN